MTQITPITLEDGTVIYMQVSDIANVNSTSVAVVTSEKELTRGDLGRSDKGLREMLGGDQGNLPQEQIINHFQAIEGTIRAYTNATLNAFRKAANAANIDKVILEFGIGISVKAGIPYVTEGSAQSSLKVTVECSFKEEKKS